MEIDLRREVVRQIINTKYSNTHIAHNVDLAPNTVRRHRKICETFGLFWDELERMSDSEFEALFTKKRMPLKHKRFPDWAYIHKQMQAHPHQTLVQLWDEYCLIDPSTAYSQSQFNYYYREYIKSIDVSMRQRHIAGECVYVDYAGKTIPWTDSKTGEVHYAQIFVGVLGCSQYTFAFASKSQKLADFIEAHNQMFTFFGGVPQVVVPDNLKSAVTKPGKFPEKNKTYVAMASHYRCVIEPARVKRPQDKSLAEIGVLLVTRWITVALRRRQFFSVEEINEAIRVLLPKINDRPFKRMEGCRSSRFEELDEPKLKALPPKPFPFGEWVTPKVVNRDYHILVDKHYYSVPYQYVGKRVGAWLRANTVEFVWNNKRIATHVRSNEVDGVTTVMSHRPEKHQAYARQNRDYYLTWAESIGEHATSVVLSQFEDKNPYSMESNRACSQLQGLAKMHGHARFEAACKCAADIANPTVKSVRSILQCRLDQREDTLPVQVQLPLHHNVRGAQYYANGGL